LESLSFPYLAVGQESKVKKTNEIH